MSQKTVALSLGLLLVLTAAARADGVTLEPAADKTLYESALGNLSNGKGVHLFAGVTAMDALRRALLRFDVASAIPPGSRITSAELHLFLSKATITSPKDVTLHRVLQAWGEGDSDASGEEGEGDFAEPGDVTWQHTFHPDSFWIADGGDNAATASATAAVGAVGPYVWTTTPELVADVQHWLDHPADDHGWAVVGTEGAGQSSRRFNSRENADVASRPVLVIDYTPPCPGGFMAYGAGLAGVGGFVPLLAGTGCPQIGGEFTLELSGGAGGAAGALFAGFMPADVPFKGGSFLVGDFVLQVSIVLGGTPGDPGAGDLSLPALLPADSLLQGVEVFLQAGLLDGAAPAGVSLTGGLTVLIG